jgi:hypothetical protein
LAGRSIVNYDGGEKKGKVKEGSDAVDDLLKVKLSKLFENGKKAKNNQKWVELSKKPV